MKLRLFYFMLMTVCSFNQVFGTDNNVCDSLNLPGETNEPMSNDTLTFVLKNGYILQWVKAEGDVIWKNDKYESVNRRKKIRLSSMVEQLGDTTSLNIYVPYKTTGPLRIGDLVLLLLMRDTVGGRIARLCGRQLHWFDSPIWGDELFDWLENDRENIVKKLCRKHQGDTTLYPK